MATVECQVPCCDSPAETFETFLVPSGLVRRMELCRPCAAEGVGVSRVPAASTTNDYEPDDEDGECFRGGEAEAYQRDQMVAAQGLK
jgi:hypothetical protein